MNLAPGSHKLSFPLTGLGLLVCCSLCHPAGVESAGNVDGVLTWQLGDIAAEFAVFGLGANGAALSLGAQYIGD